MAENIKDFVAGTLGGFAGKLLDYPFDTVNVLLQTQSVGQYDAAVASATTATTTAVGSASSSAAAASATTRPPPPKAQPPVMYRGAFHCLQHTIETQGFLSLYRGLSSPLLGSMAENAVLFVAYNAIKRQMEEKWLDTTSNQKELSLLQLSLAGAGAGAFVPFVLTPFELVKCRLQVQNSISSGSFTKYKGPIDVVVQTVKNEGIVGGLYKGNGATLLREIPGNFCWYGAYEGTCMMMIPEGGTKKDLGPTAHLLGGALAGVAYWTAFYPADTVKSQMQTNPHYSGSGFFQSLNKIYQKEGLQGLYRGWGITAARAAPAHALIFATYEFVSKRLSSTSHSFDVFESVRD